MRRGSFLERWSRRKLTSDKAEGAAPEPAEARDEGPPPGDAEAPPLSEAPQEEILDEAEIARLPPIEEITAKTDLAPFLRKGVPQALRNAALRKMWMLDPAIRDHVDFAVDYAWDWNVPGGVPGNAGTISPKGLARMLDDLKPKGTAAAKAQADSPAEASSPEAPSQTPQEASEERIATVGPEAQSQMPKEAPDGSGRDAPDTTPGHHQMARRRRHGGAAPL